VKKVLRLFPGLKSLKVGKRAAVVKGPFLLGESHSFIWQGCDDLHSVFYSWCLTFKFL